MQKLFQKYRHALVLLYGFFYMPWFMWLESRANLPYHVIHVRLDDMIPFVEYFIVPYTFVVRVCSRSICIPVFQKPAGFLPVLHFSLRWYDSVFDHLYRISERAPAAAKYFPAEQYLHFCGPAPVPGRHGHQYLPSLHVFNSIAAHRAVANDAVLGKNRLIRSASFILMASIILATVFLKQHSVLDVIAGILLGVVMDQLVYRLITPPSGTAGEGKENRRRRKRLPPTLLHTYNAKISAFHSSCFYGKSEIFYSMLVKPDKSVRYLVGHFGNFSPAPARQVHGSPEDSPFQLIIQLPVFFSLNISRVRIFSAGSPPFQSGWR